MLTFRCGLSALADSGRSEAHEFSQVQRCPGLMDSVARGACCVSGMRSLLQNVVADFTGQMRI